MELGSNDYFSLPGASFYYWVNERMSGMASQSCPNSLIKRHGHFQGSLRDFFNHSGSPYLYFIIFNDDMGEGRAFVLWQKVDLSLPYPSPYYPPRPPPSKLLCFRPWFAQTSCEAQTPEGLGGMSCYVDDMAISNHGNLPSQASVAPRA